MRVVRVWSVIAGIVSTLVTGPSAPAEAALTVQWTAARLGVIADQIPLADVLGEVARRTGLRVRGAETLPDETISVRFSGLSLREGLGRLLSRLSDYVIVEDVTADGTDRLTLVFWRKGTSPHAVVAGVEEQDVEARLEALRASSEYGDEGRLWEAVSDPNAVVQATAVELLHTRNAQAATAALLEAAKSRDGNARLEALHLLSDTAAPEDRLSVVSALESALTDEDATVKDYAIQALASSGSGAIRALGKALRDPDPSVRMTVVENAAQMSDGLPLLQAALADANEDVRSLAKLWLRQLTLQGR